METVGILDVVGWRPNPQQVLDLAGATVIALVTTVTWFVVGPITVDGSSGPPSLAEPAWHACCMVDNHLSWRSSAIALAIPTAIAAAAGTLRARARFAVLGSTAGVALVLLIEATDPLTTFVPPGAAGRAAAAAYALAWPLAALGATAAGRAIRRSWRR